jgi:hypothetical protein
VRRTSVRSGLRGRWPWWLACLVLTLGVASGCRRHAPSPMPSVAVEVFAVAFDADGLLYWRDIQPLTRSGGVPENAVRALLAKHSRRSPSPTPVTRVIHSTSWRYEAPGQIVLTYLACVAPDGEPLPDAIHLRMDELPGLAPTDPLHPRPPVIRERDVLAHGLRHLALLMNREPEGELARALNPAGRMMLWRLNPTVAGQLSVPERQ